MMKLFKGAFKNFELQIKFWILKAFNLKAISFFSLTFVFSHKYIFLSLKASKNKKLPLKSFDFLQFTDEALYFSKLSSESCDIFKFDVFSKLIFFFKTTKVELFLNWYLDFKKLIFIINILIK